MLVLCFTGSDAYLLTSPCFFLRTVLLQRVERLWWAGHTPSRVLACRGKPPTRVRHWFSMAFHPRATCFLCSLLFSVL
jgi:hypothetical protein